MTGFFQSTGRGEGHPVADVVGLRWRAKTGGQPATYLADLRDERCVRISHYTYRDIIDPVVATIAAAPGYFVIVGVPDGELNPDCVWRERVIAWQIRQEGDVAPVTIGGPWHDPTIEPAPIEQPDGRVFTTSDEECFRTLVEYLGHLRQRKISPSAGGTS